MSRFVPVLSLLIVAFSSVAEETGGPGATTVPGATGSGAATAGGAAGAHPPATFDPSMFVLILGAVLFMWLLVIRPQKKEEKRRQEMVNSMKPGHKVVTIGGVHGEVVAVGEATVDLKVGHGNDGVVMTFNKGAVSTNVTLADVKPAK